MATFTSLPTELRLKIYRELFIPKPRASRICQYTRDPVALYIDHTFHTALLGVSKKVHEEANSVLYGETVWTLHVYLIFRGDKYHGSNLDCALRSLKCSNHFPYIRNCVLDVRLFRDQSGERNTTFSGIDALHAHVQTVHRLLSRARGLRSIEVSWRDYANYNMTESVRRLLEPLQQLPTTYELFIGTVENDIGGLNESSYWPNMLRAYRVMLFGRIYGENNRIAGKVAKSHGRVLWPSKHTARN